MKKAIDDYIAERMYHYQKLFISYIKNNPHQRYQGLVDTQPEIFEKSTSSLPCTITAWFMIDH